MKEDRRALIHRINYLTSEMNGLYHQSSLKLGITDSVSVVLYTIYDAGGECLLGDIQKNSGISKQTIHSAVRSLESEGILCLEPHDGRSKRVLLTPKGKVYLEATVARLYQAEVNAFDSWTREEVEAYVALMEKYLRCFSRQVEKL